MGTGNDVHPRSAFPSASLNDPSRQEGALSRRGFFAGLGVAGVGAALASCAESAQRQEGPEEQPQQDALIVDFDGPHQAGIATEPQAHALLVGYNLKNSPGAGRSLGPQQRTAVRRDLTRLMRIWTTDARAMTEGRGALADLEAELNEDPGGLTITVGWSPRLATAVHDPRQHPSLPRWIAKHLNGLPAFRGDKLDPAFGGTDVVLQICGHNLTTVSHAARVLTRGGRDYTRPEWTQRGFIDAKEGQTPRNLLGFKDGTAQPITPEEYEHNIWDSLGGSSMVVRRVVFDMPGWEQLDRMTREVVFGRSADTGAPLGREDEHDEVDLSRVDGTGLPFIDRNSHVGIAAGQGHTMRRRSYNWDGEISALGDSGLIFISFQNDPAVGFTPLQRRLADKDRLNEWVTHVGSALYWVLPGTNSGSYWGQQFLEG